MLYQFLKEQKEKTYDLSSLQTVLVGGAAASQTLVESFEKDLGLPILHAWGMTETSPIGTVSRLKSTMNDWTDEQKLAVRLKQGIPVVGVEVRILGDQDEDLPWDGEHAGELVVRGPWIAKSYYNNPGAEASFTPDGWFRTGDIAMIDRHGYVQITDRKKDLIKRKGEWISSVDMENLVLAHPGVLEAAVVGRVCDVRDEVPVVFVVTRPDLSQPRQATRDHRSDRHQVRPVAVAQARGYPLRRVAAQDRRRQAGQEGDSQDAGESNSEDASCNRPDGRPWSDVLLSVRHFSRNASGDPFLMGAHHDFRPSYLWRVSGCRAASARGTEQLQSKATFWPLTSRPGARLAVMPKPRCVWRSGASSMVCRASGSST